MGEFKAREESGFQSSRLLADGAAGAVRGPTLQDLRGVIERNFGGTPFATLGQFTAKTIGIVAGNIDRTLGVSSFFGEPAYRPHAAIINDITKTALASAQQGQIEKARESIKEADEKLAYAMEMKKREKELDESEKTEKGKEEGGKDGSKKDEVKEALHAVFSDAGTVNAERAEMAGQAAGFFAKNRGILGLPEMKGQKKAVLGFIASLGNDAKAKAGFDKDEKGAEFERIKGMVAPIAKQKLDSALASVSEAAESAIRMLEQKGISKEFKKALEGIRDLSKDIRSQLKEGKLVSDEQLRNVDKAVSYAKEAYANLSRIAEKLRGPASEIFARAIKAIEGGDEKTAGLHDFLAKEYAGAASKARETLGNISASLGSGKMKAPEALSDAAKYISGILRGSSEGIKDAGILGSLKKIFGKLDGGSAGVNDLKAARFAADLADDYKKDMRGLAKNKKAQEGAGGIYGRALSSAANGLLSFASRQGALAKLFGKKRMSGARDQIEAVSKKADTIGKLRQMHQLIKEGMKPEDAARLCSGEGEDLLGQYMAMADPEAELQAAEGNLDLFIFAAEARSGFAKRMGKDESGICKAAVEWLDAGIIAKVAGGEEPTRDEIRALFALVAMHEGSVDGMGQFLLGGQWPPGTMNGVLGMEGTLEGLHGEDRLAAEDMLWSAQQALFGGRFEEAAGHMLAANAAAALKGEDRKMLEDMSYAVACEGSESAQSLMWVARAQLDRAALGENARGESGAYFDIAIITFMKGDFNGAQIALSSAKLFGRAEGVGKTDIRAQEARGIVRELLGDCRNIGGRLLFGEGAPRGMAGNDAPLLANLEAASSKGGEVAAWLSGFVGEKKLVALALKIEKSNIELGRAEMGSVLVGLSDEKYQDVYRGQEDRYLDKAVLAEKSGKAEKARAMREEAERTASLHDRAKESAMAYEAGASMKEQEIERILGELKTGGEPTATEAYRNGSIIMSLAEKAMAAEASLHESIVNVRTDHKEEGRAELARAAESYLKAATTLEGSGFVDANLIAYAGADLDAGIGKVAVQKTVQREMKRIEQELLGIVSECRVENDKNREEFAEGGFDTPKYDIYYDDGRIPAGKEGALIHHEERAKELDLAEDDAKKHKFDESVGHISLAKAGMQIDRFRVTVEREFRRMYPEIQGSYWSEEAFEIADVMGEFGYGDMMTDLFNADRLLGKGDLEGAGEMMDGFDTRLAINITAQQIALQEFSLGKMSSGLSDMANAAGGFGLDPAIVKESGVDFSLGAREGYAKMNGFLKYKRMADPFGWGAHYDNVKAVRANTGAYAITDKAAALKKKADAVISLLHKERETLREREKAGDGAAALGEAGGRLEKLAVSGERIAKKYSRFNDGFQIWVSCSAQMLNMLDGVDSIEKQRGHEHALELRYEPIREDAAVMGQLARIVSDDPEKAVKLITSGESVAYRMGSGEYTLRDEYGGYAAATLEFSARNGSFAELFEEVTERSLQVAEGIAVGDFGGRGRAQEIARNYTSLVMANSGIVKDGGAYKRTKMSAAERELAANALNGSGGANEMIGLFFSAPATLTSFFSTDEGGSALDAVGTGIAEKTSIIQDLASARIRGEPVEGDALEACSARLKRSGAEAMREYEAFIKEGLSDESTARGIKAVLEMGLSVALTASGLGSVAGVYSGTMALKDLAFQSDRAGGFDNLSTFDQVMGVTNVALGFADGAASYMGELGKGASEVSAGVSLAGNGFGASRFSRTAMSFMAGGNAATWTGRVLGSASLVTGGIGIYQAAGSFSEGRMNWFEFGVTMLSALQPAIDHGSAALGKTRLARLADDSGRGGFGKIAAKTARGFIGVLSGNLVKNDAEAYRAVERMEEHGAAYRRLDGGQKKEYAKTVALLERVLGRTMDHEEGLFAMAFIRDGDGAEPAAIAFLAKPKADRMFELHLRKKAGEEVDMAGMGADGREFFDSIRSDDNRTAYERIYAHEAAKAKKEMRELGHGDISIGVSQKIKLARDEYMRIAEFAEALSLSKEGAISEVAKARLDIDDEQARFIDTLRDEGIEAVGDQLTWLLLFEKAGDDARALEATVGIGQGSPALEAALRSQEGPAQGRKGRASRKIAAVARTLEWASGANDAGNPEQGAGMLANAFAENPEYKEALARISAATAEERISVIVHEAGTIAYGRKEKELKAAMEGAGFGEGEAGIAISLFRALNGEPVEAGLALLDKSAMDKLRESTRNGMEEADAVVEAAAEIVQKGKDGGGYGKISDGGELDALYRAIFDDTQRMVEDEIGDTPGSPELESELAAHAETVSGGKGEGKAGAETVKVARTLERLLMQRESGEGFSVDTLMGFCASYPDYKAALKNLESAKPDELPGLIRQEALSIVNARRSQEIEDAIAVSGIGGETAGLARAIFNSIVGEPVKADIAYLDASVIEKALKASGEGKDAAEAAVEAAVSIMKERTDGSAAYSAESDHRDIEGAVLGAERLGGTSAEEREDSGSGSRNPHQEDTSGATHDEGNGAVLDIPATTRIGSDAPGRTGSGGHAGEPIATDVLPPTAPMSEGGSATADVEPTEAETGAGGTRGAVAALDHDPVFTRETASLEGDAGSELSRMFNVPQDELVFIFSHAHSASEARRDLYARLGISLGSLPSAEIRSAAYRNFASLSDDPYLSGMILTGELMPNIEQAVRPDISDLAPGDRIVVSEINFQNGLVGAYRMKIRVVDGHGNAREFTDGGGRKKTAMNVFIKRQDLTPDAIGSEGGVLTGAPSPQILVGGGQGALEYTSPDGTATGYGIMRDIHDYCGAIDAGGHLVEVTVDAADDLYSLAYPNSNDGGQREQLFSELRDNPDQFIEALGYAQTGFAAAGFYDRHEGNVWAMWLRIGNEPPSEAARIANDLRGQGYRVRDNADGSFSFLRFGAIDTDTFGSYRAEVKADGGVSLDQMARQFTLDLHRVLVRLTLELNTAETQLSSGLGRRPDILSVDDVVARVFGAGDDGPWMRGMMRWISEFGQHTQTGAKFSESVRELFSSYHGQRSGMGFALAGSQLAGFERNGYVPLGVALNGLPLTIVDGADGRTSFMAEGERSSYPLVSETADASLAPVVPESGYAYMVRIDDMDAHDVEALRSALGGSPREYSGEAAGGRTFIVAGDWQLVPPEFRDRMAAVTRSGDEIRCYNPDAFMANFPEGRKIRMLRIDESNAAQAKEAHEAGRASVLELGLSGKHKFLLFEDATGIPQELADDAVVVQRLGNSLVGEEGMREALGIANAERIGAARVFEHMMGMGESGWVGLWGSVRDGIMHAEANARAAMDANFLMARVPRPDDISGLPKEYGGLGRTALLPTEILPPAPTLPDAPPTVPDAPPTVPLPTVPLSGNEKTGGGQAVPTVKLEDAGGAGAKLENDPTIPALPPTVPLAQSDDAAGGKQAPQLDGLALARIARDILLGNADEGGATGHLPVDEQGIVNMLARDTKFILNASGDGDAFERFIGNKRTGGKLIEEMRAKVKKAGTGNPE